ncbi:MAG TPA: hypothetical protein VGF71_11860 [Caulobacteraceae bacterium]|jgi:hypothetical protein
MDSKNPKVVGGKGWDDLLADISGNVEALRPIIQDSLGRADTSDFEHILKWCGQIRRELDRIEYAARVALPVAELDDQIAVHEAAERLRLARERVAQTKSRKEGD